SQVVAHVVLPEPLPVAPRLRLVEPPVLGIAGALVLAVGEVEDVRGGLGRRLQASGAARAHALVASQCGGEVGRRGADALTQRARTRPRSPGRRPAPGTAPWRAPRHRVAPRGRMPTARSAAARRPRPGAPSCSGGVARAAAGSRPRRDRGPRRPAPRASTTPA